jgi:hypothetical protein
MNTKWKSIYSVMAIGIFAVFAAASIGPDKSTNTTVAIDKCQTKPSFQGQLSIYVEVKDQHGASVEANGKLYIVHQKVRPDTTCSFDVLTNLVHDFSVVPNQIYFYDGPAFSHDNSEDLFRVELKINGSTTHANYQEVKVIKYAEQNINFLAIVNTYDNL